MTINMITSSPFEGRYGGMSYSAKIDEVTKNTHMLNMERRTSLVKVVLCGGEDGDACGIVVRLGWCCDGLLVDGF